jgi:hypothetical protein
VGGVRSKTHQLLLFFHYHHKLNQFW